MKWTEAQKKTLIDLYPVLPNDDLVAMLGMSKATIRTAATRYGVKKKGRLCSWSYADECKLIELFPYHSNLELGEMFGRTEKTIMAAGHVLGLLKDTKWKLERSSVGFFKPGHVPANKGKCIHDYLSTEVYDRIKKTQFKKGHAPHNTKYDGHERISKDGYVEIRIAKGKYVLKHRHVWEQHNGVVPNGMIVVFKDGDKRNISIDNLELISREENMKRNTYHNYPKEIANLIQLRGALNRQINKAYEKQNSRLEKSLVRANGKAQ